MEGESCFLSWKVEEVSWDHNLETGTMPGFVAQRDPSHTPCTAKETPDKDKPLGLEIPLHQSASICALLELDIPAERLPWVSWILVSGYIKVETK